MANTPPSLALVAVEAGPPSPPPEAQATIHSLPLELVHHIIKMTLPRVRFDTFEERYETLRACCLVSKAWNQCARRELWQHVYITKPAVLGRFEAALGLSGGGCDKLVRSLRVGVRRKGDCTRVRLLMDRLLGCEELWAVGVYHDEGDVESLDTSAFASRIQRLHLDVICPLPPSPNTPLAFPRLVEISLSYSMDQPKGVEFLQHADMPHLRSLGICGWTADPSTTPSPLLIAALNRLAPQLETFSFIPLECSDADAHDLDWTKFANLRKLALRIPAAGARILDRIPVKLQALRYFNFLDATTDWMQKLEGILRDWAPCMERLERLVLPAGAEADNRFARFCLAKGVQEEYDTLPHDVIFWDLWEELVIW